MDNDKIILQKYQPACIFCNNAELFHFSYQRYLENCLRETFGFHGTPIKLIIRMKGDDADVEISSGADEKSDEIDASVDAAGEAPVIRMVNTIIT